MLLLLLWVLLLVLLGFGRGGVLLQQCKLLQVTRHVIVSRLIGCHSRWIIFTAAAGGRRRDRCVRMHMQLLLLRVLLLLLLLSDGRVRVWQRSCATGE